MLIQLINFKPKTYSFENNLCKIQAAEHIFLAHGQRKHIVLVDKEPLNDVISELTPLGGSTIKYAYDILMLRNETKGLRGIVSIYIIVDFDSTLKLTTERKGNTTIVTCSYKLFVDISKCGCSRLLTENKDDFDMYIHLANFYAKHTIDSKVNVNFDLIPGGGSTIKSLFEHQKEKNELTLCLLDSDKKHPDSPYGSTAKSFSDKDISTITSLSQAHVLSVHELESIIPYEIIKDTIDNGTYSNDIQDHLDVLNCFSDTDFRRYFDHKKGLSIKTAIDLDKKYNNYYWVPLLLKHKNWGNKDCLINSTCYNCKDCGVINGLGSSLLSNVVTYLENKNIRNYKNKINGFIYQEWLMLGLLLFSWGCVTSQRLSKS